MDGHAVSLDSSGNLTKLLSKFRARRK